MATANLEIILDGDGHVMEDMEEIAKFMDPVYKDRGVVSGRGVFPPLDHLHGAHAVSTPGTRDRVGTRVGPEEWLVFAREVGIEATVLYPTSGLAYGRIVNYDWAISTCRAYNDWLHATYMQRSPLFKGMALIPMQEPSAAIEELHRAVEELGMCGAMLPSTGLPNHLGAKEYWPVYQAAEKLGCAIAIHGGCHMGLGMDHMNVYAPVNALGHPFGQMIALSSMVFNGVFDRFPNIKVAFLEGGVAWFLTCLERLDRSHATHTEYQVRDGDLLGPRAEESVADYIVKHVKAGRIFVGCEGGEPTMGYAVKAVGQEPWIYSSDFPHEPSLAMVKEEIGEVLESEEISTEDKAAILHGNAGRFYRLGPNGT